MKKLLVLILTICTLLFSCSTTEKVAAPADYVEPVVETVAVNEEAPAPEPVIDEPLVRKVPEKKEPVVTEEPVEETPVVEPAVEEPVAEEIPVPEEETLKETVLKGKALVEQISAEEKNAREKVEETPVATETPVPPVEDPVPEAPVAKAEETVTEVETEAEEVKPLPPAPQIERKDQSVKTEETPRKEETVLDATIDSDVMIVVGEIISILIIFTLSSVIRNKYSRPLSIGLSFLLAILFTAIPMLIAFILFGWSNLHLMFLSLIFTVFVFASRKGH